MVRNYIRKTEKPAYTENEMKNAIEKILAKEWTYEKAFSITNIPIGTLASRIFRKSNQQVGRPTALTTTEEKYLVDLIIKLQDYGELSACNDVLKYATEFVDIMDLKCRFKNGQPTRDWYYNFIGRWKDRLKIMNSTKLEKVRADAVTCNTIDGWFAKVHSVLTKLDLFNKPQQIFNCDESGFRDDPGKKKVVVARETKYAEKIHCGSGKESTTVLLTISASGSCLPPYVIYRAKCLYDIWCPRNVIRGAVFNRTETGWIDEKTFFDYLNNQFIPQTKHIPRPILLIFDGHTSHLSLKTVRLAIDNQIHLLCLPAHATHILQPLDVYTLKYVKTQWRNLLWEHSKKHAVKKLEKPAFIRLYSELYNYALLPTHCAAAFGKAGIFPYDPRVIKRDRLIKTSSNSNTSTSLSRSKSVEFDYRDNETTITMSTIITPTVTAPPATTSAVTVSPITTSTVTVSPITIDTNRTRQLVKYPSDPSFLSGYNGINKSKRNQTSPNETRDAINSLDDALRATDSIFLSTSNTSIQPLTSSSISSNLSDMSTSNTNDDLSVLSKSKENDRSLDAIEMIVKKHFSQSSTSSKVKKRLVSGANGRSITDLDEFALTTIRKKKTAETKVSKRKYTKKKTDTQKQNVLPDTNIYSANGTNVTSTGTHNAQLPPIAYILPSNTSSMISPLQSNTSSMISPLQSNTSSMISPLQSNTSSMISPSQSNTSSMISPSQPNINSYLPLQNLPSTSYMQCQLCFNSIKPLETTSNCSQCHRILCWECSYKIDKNYQLCHICRSYYTSQQQIYFSQTLYQ